MALKQRIDRGRQGMDEVKTSTSQRCPHESKVKPVNININPLCHSDRSSDSFPPSHESRQNSTDEPTRPTFEEQQRQQVSLRHDGSSVVHSKKSSLVSNYKMDFIDPGRTGSGMISSRNSGRKNDLCQRFVELPVNGSKTLNYDGERHLPRNTSKLLAPSRTALAILTTLDL